MTVKKKRRPHKYSPRPTTARFNTDESRMLLRALTLAREGGLMFDRDEKETLMFYKIRDRLEERILSEEKKKKYQEVLSAPQDKSQQESKSPQSPEIPRS